ncbi:hypothetical protein H0H92_000964 [Tricholoma furcatifolium]|nr:hypothetical protein H0H92_000964 [Tricholoma furcatifolium]
MYLRDPPQWLPEVILLRRRDNAARLYLQKQTIALEEYFTLQKYFVPPPKHVVKWARLRLPNGQISRAAWVEKLKPLSKIRAARNIKSEDIACLQLPNDQISHELELLKILTLLKISNGPLHHTIKVPETLLKKCTQNKKAQKEHLATATAACKHKTMMHTIYSNDG